MGSLGGLLRYDGYVFKVLKSTPGDSTSISSNLVTALALSRTGNIWVGTADGGLCKLEIPLERFRRFRFQGDRPVTVRAILEDPSGLVWVGTEGNGLFLLDSSGVVLQHFNPGPPGRGFITSGVIHSISGDQTGTIFVGTPAGLNVSDSGRSSFAAYRRGTRQTTLGSDTVRAVLSDIDGSVWVGTSRGLYCFDPHKKTFVSRWVSGYGVTVLRQQDQRHLWIGTTAGGLHRFEKSAGTVTSFVHRSDEPNGLLNNTVLDILVDRGGTTWVATDRGVSRITSRALQFGLFSLGTASPAKFVSAIGQDRDGRFWVGGYGTKQMGRNEEWFLKDTFVSSIYCDSGGVLWLGTSRGLFRHRPNSTSFEALPFRHRISRMAEDKRGILWLAAYPDGVFGFDKKRLRVVFPADGVKPERIGGDDVSAIYVDRNNDVWIATEGNGLRCFRQNESILEQFLHNPNSPESLSNNRVYDIHEDQEGLLWMTTGAGIDAFDRGKRMFTHLSVNDGLPDVQLQDIEEDGGGDLWVTAAGSSISRISPKTGRITNYFAEDGFHRTSVLGAFSKSSEGEFLIGGMDGFTRFFPDSIEDNKEPPPIQLTNLIIAGKSIPFDPLLMKDGLTFSYNENFLGFAFAVLDFVSPKRNRHAYQLEGVDPAWVYIEEPRQINYGNLSPGSYTLRIIGANSDGYWNNTGISLPFSIKPPWWETWYFRLGVFASVASALVFLYRIRIANLMERERLKAKISAELHDEIGSGLTRIALLTEIARKRAEGSKAHEGSDDSESGKTSEEAISRIGLLARELHETMGDVVWSISPKNHSMESYVQRVTRYLNEVCEARGIELSMEIDEKVGALEARPELLHNLLLVTKEAMTNIARHSQSTTVSFEMRRNAGIIQLVISDNGRGFDPGQVHGNGLQNMSKRIRELSGSMVINSETGRGTILFMSIPYEKN